MNPNKWEQLVYLAEEKFGIDKKETNEEVVDVTHKGKKIKGEREILEFESPVGRVRMERLIKPKVIDKNIKRSKRAGAKASVDLVYSDTETVSEMNLYKQNDEGEWDEIKPQDLNG